MIHEKEEEFSEADSTSDSPTSKYLSHVEDCLYNEVNHRKMIDSGLLFLSCQISSTSVAWVFASMQISTSIMVASCITISLIPGIVDAGDSFRMELSSDRWEISHSKPLVAISKLIIGLTISWNSSQSIARDIWRTESNIQSIYTDVKNSKSDGWISIPMADVILPVLIASIIGMAFLKLKPKNNANAP
jgi:hypothetical protein